MTKETNIAVIFPQYILDYWSECDALWKKAQAPLPKNVSDEEMAKAKDVRADALDDYEEVKILLKIGLDDFTIYSQADIHRHLFGKIMEGKKVELSSGTREDGNEANDHNNRVVIYVSASKFYELEKD